LIRGQSFKKSRISTTFLKLDIKQKKLTNVVIPNSVKTIEKNAFDDDVEIIRK